MHSAPSRHGVHALDRVVKPCPSTTYTNMNCLGAAISNQVSDHAGPGPGSIASQAVRIPVQNCHRQRHARNLRLSAVPDTNTGIITFPRPLLPQHQAQAAPINPNSAASVSSPPSSSAATLNPAGPTDLRLDLWLSLLQASAVQLSSAAASAANAVNGATVRLQRLSQPPPTLFPAGPQGDQTLALLSDPLRFLSETTARYGPVAGLLLGGERVVLVTGREEARIVLMEEAGSVYVKEGTAFFPGSSLAGNGLLVSDGALWQRQRRLSNPAFRRAAVEAYSDAMVAATADMMEGVWAAGGCRDVYADFNELTLQVTLEALFGFGVKERQAASAAAAGTSAPPIPGAPGSVAAAPHSASAASSEEAQQIVTAVEKAFTFFTQRAATGFVIPEWLPTWDNLEFAAAVQQLDRVVYGMITRRRNELVAAHGSIAAAAAAAAGGGPRGASSSSSVVPSDLLTSLLLSRDEDGSGMTDGALRDELMTLLVAGQETSAILLGWAAALLAAYPEVQRRAAEEVVRVCGREALPNAASVRLMPYLESVVLETLRLYSPAYMVGRCARVDATLGSYILPAGTTVLVSPYIMHRDPTAWDQPEAFLPERWHELQGRPGYQGYMGLMSNLGPNGTYLPFGGGPRNCIGTGFAMMEAMLVLAALLQRYSLTLPSPPSQQQRQQQQQRADGARSGFVEGGLPASFPRPKPLLTLRPEAVVLQISPCRAGGTQGGAELS